MRLAFFALLVICLTYCKAAPMSAGQYVDVDSRVMFFGGEKRSGLSEHSIHELNKKKTPLRRRVPSALLHILRSRLLQSNAAGEAPAWIWSLIRERNIHVITQARLRYTFHDIHAPLPIPPTHSPDRCCHSCVCCLDRGPVLSLRHQPGTSLLSTATDPPNSHTSDCLK